MDFKVHYFLPTRSQLSPEFMQRRFKHFYPLVNDWLRVLKTQRQQIFCPEIVITDPCCLNQEAT